MFENIKSILNSSGLSNIWLEQTTHSTKWLKAKIKLALTDQFKQNWQSTVQSSPKALNYRMYKDEKKIRELLQCAFKKLCVGFAFVITIYQ